MLTEVEAALRRYAMVTAGERVVVAVSGGPDSVALLHCLHRLAPSWQLQLFVFHLHHGLRGADADADAAYVEGLADALGWPVRVVRAKVKAEAEAKGVSVQVAGREARYRELEAYAAEVGAQRIALGHHADDQAETVLMRLLRGSGPQGLAGIWPVRGRIIRPLLTTTRSSIEKYCYEMKLNPRLDPSNLTPAYQRNKIRLELLPLLQAAYNPNVSQGLSQLAELLQAEEVWLEPQTKAAYVDCLLETEGAERILLTERLTKLPLALARRVLRQAFADLGAAEPPFAAIEGALALATPGLGAREVTLAGGLWARRAAERLYVRATPPGFEGGVGVVGVPVPSEVVVGGWRLRTQLVDRLPEGGGQWAAFDAAKLPGPLVVRSRQAGDRLWPTGMAGSQKVHDLMVNEKVARHRRGLVPILTSAEQVLWVIGLRLDRRFLAGPESQQIVLVEAWNE